jgi:hypothetical protein
MSRDTVNNRRDSQALSGPDFAILIEARTSHPSGQIKIDPASRPKETGSILDSSRGPAVNPDLNPTLF